MSSPPPPHIVLPTAAHTHTIILLHGRGSNASELTSEFFESQASDSRFLPQIFPNFKWVFPCAAMRYAKTEDENMHQWFDMESVQNPCHDPDKIQIPGMQESIHHIRNIVQQEAAIIGGRSKVFLGGISQGCATAMAALLALGQPLAGFIGFSGWCAFSDALPNSLYTDLRDKIALAVWLKCRLPDHEKTNILSIKASLLTPMLLQHAKDDGVVPVALARDLRSKMARLDVDVEWREYEEGGHWINEPEGIDDMVAFVNAQSST